MPIHSHTLNWWPFVSHLLPLQVGRQSSYSVSSSSSSSSSEGGDLEGGGLGFSGDLELELPDMSSDVTSPKTEEASHLAPLRCALEAQGTAYES